MWFERLRRTGLAVPWPVEDDRDHGRALGRGRRQVIGGCCGIGPDHIRLLAERLPGTVPRPDA